MNFRILPAAQADARWAGDYLQAVRRGYGAKFASEFRRAVASIRANPRMYPRTDDGPEEPENREYFISRFEYRVIYAIWHNDLVIVAVLHAARRPALWIHRLDDITPPEDRT